MNYYLAPLEGITGYVYRNAYHNHFQPLDKYFTPFLVPNQHKCFSSRELNDVLPEHNQGLFIVPQLLTNKADEFCWAAGALAELGYQEINLNLGCPSKTVVTKGKGSGFLAKPEVLNNFLEEIFSKSNIRISLKTRLGKDDPDEFYELLEIFNKYPLTELIIHPRIQTDYYKNQPNYELFQHALKTSKNPIIYNGDIFSIEDLQNFQEQFPTVETIMMGRGILRDPRFTQKCQNQSIGNLIDLRNFHDQIYCDYQKLLSGERNVLFKMKELWLYLNFAFTNSDKYLKKIKKAQNQKQYDEIVNKLFKEQHLV